jgi:hypothetical protein
MLENPFQQDISAAEGVQEEERNVLIDHDHEIRGITIIFDGIYHPVNMGERRELVQTF